MKKPRLAADAPGVLPVELGLFARLVGDGRAVLRVDFPGEEDDESHVFVTVRQTKRGITTVARGESVDRDGTSGTRTVLVTAGPAVGGPGLRLGKAFVEVRVYAWAPLAVCEYGSISRVVHLWE